MNPPKEPSPPPPTGGFIPSSPVRHPFLWGEGFALQVKAYMSLEYLASYEFYLIKWYSSKFIFSDDELGIHLETKIDTPKEFLKFYKL